MDIKPTIVAFLCNWCSHTGADSAGTSRMKYSADIKIIRVMCSGRIDPTFVLKAFREGADGILMCGCHPGDCHYQSGNYKCMRRYKLLQKYIQQMGVNPARIRLEWISASEGKQFAELADEMSDTINKLGKCKIRESIELIT